MRILETDALVVGGGIAGCVYAHQAAKKGLKTIMLCCGDLPEANSDLAQGGIVYEPNLDMDALLKDVKLATAGLCNESAVRQISEAGCRAVKEICLTDLNIKFDRDDKKNLCFTREGAHQKNRIIYSKACDKKRGTAAYPQYHHKETFLVTEKISHGNLGREFHMMPDKSHMFQQNLSPCCRC